MRWDAQSDRTRSNASSACCSFAIARRFNAQLCAGRRRGPGRTRVASRQEQDLPGQTGMQHVRAAALSRSPTQPGSQHVLPRLHRLLMARVTVCQAANRAMIVHTCHTKAHMTAMAGIAVAGREGLKAIEAAATLHTCHLLQPLIISCGVQALLLPSSNRHLHQPRCDLLVPLLTGSACGQCAAWLLLIELPCACRGRAWAEQPRMQQPRRWCSRLLGQIQRRKTLGPPAPRLQMRVIQTMPDSKQRPTGLTLSRAESIKQHGGVMLLTPC